jgi:hypothetical protein
LNTLIRIRLLKAALSAVATVAGILAGVIAMRILGAEDAALSALIISMVAVPVWLLILLPLAICVPVSSRLWHPVICTVLSAFVGGGILLLGFGLLPGYGLDIAAATAPFGALVGGVAGFVGSTAARCLHITRPA